MSSDEKDIAEQLVEAVNKGERQHLAISLGKALNADIYMPERAIRSAGIDRITADIIAEHARREIMKAIGSKYIAKGLTIQELVG